MSGVGADWGECAAAEVRRANRQQAELTKETAALKTETANQAADLQSSLARMGRCQLDLEKETNRRLAVEKDCDQLKQMLKSKLFHADQS